MTLDFNRSVFGISYLLCCDLADVVVAEAVIGQLWPVVNVLVELVAEFDQNKT
jgi:hypothetical protein